MDLEELPSAPPLSPWTDESPWTYPSGGDYGPPPWPPYYWAPPPPPPQRSRWRPWAALGAIILILAGLGAGVAIAIQRVSTGTLTSGPTGSVNAAVVDVNTDLGGGNSAAGTGMLIGSSGQVLTNNHVVEGALSISVTMVATGRSFDASVVGVDPTDDVAVIKLSGASGLPTVPLGNSSRVTVGDGVTAIGNALGRGGPPAVTQGTVTALGQTVTATDPSGGDTSETLTDMIEFNAEIQPGDSGGPLVNSNGKVVGMDTAGGGQVRRRDNLGSSLGFAIPINGAMSIARQITSGSGGPNITQAHTPLLGVEAQDSQSPPGALVIGVQPNSPADGAGIVAQDVIVSVNGTTVGSTAALHSALLQHKPGDTVDVGWLDAGGGQHHASVQLASGGVP